MAKPELMGLNQLASTEFSSGLFLNQYELTPEAAWVNEICGAPREAPGAFFDYGWSESAFQMNKRTDGWQLRRMKAGTGRLEMVNWRDGFMEKDDIVRRDVHGIISSTMQKFAEGSKRTLWTRMAISQIELGETLTSPVDGATFFSAVHALNGSAATRRNIFTSSQDSRLNVTTPTRPTVLEFADCVRAVIRGLFQITDVNSDQPNENADSFLVLVHSDIADVAKEACGKSQVLGTGGVMVSNTLPDTFDVSSAHSARLASADVFYVFVRTSAGKPIMRVYENLPSGPEYQVTTADGVRFTHHDMSVAANQISGEHQMLVEANRNMGFGDWYYAAKATMS